MTDWALELAENANTYVPLPPGDERTATDRYVLWRGRADHPNFNSAQRFRLRIDELDDARAEIQAWFLERGRSVCAWEIGSSATPSDLAERLLELGLVEDEEPMQIGMALSSPPSEPAPAGIEVRRAESPEERQLAAEIASEVFGTPLQGQPQPFPGSVLYLAYLDGEPVARASGGFSEHGVTLFGGATLPEARGRGAYRALVHARWDEAVRRGTPLAVTQASRNSRPILARLGFREVCTIRALIDRFG
jgi:GNAT superfamily N-acetyltransferase